MPRPLADHDTKPFWDGCRERRFLLPKCSHCGYLRWPPGPMCPRCQSMNTDWIPASGQGRVYSWVVATHPVAPLLADQVPYVIALVDLDEGVRVVANIEGCEPRDIAAGMEVDLHFEDLDDEVTIPNFRIRQSDQLEK